MRLRRFGVGLCAIGALAMPLSACSEPEDSIERDEAAPSSEPTRSRQTPAARSGDLGQEDLPLPKRLGDGWEYRVDRGNAEDGYVGSGQPAIARDPVSVIEAITPLGCRPRRLPLPERALEVTYQRQATAGLHRATPGVGLILQFDDAASAGEFFTQHSRVLSECVRAKRVDVDILEASRATFLSTRSEQLGETPSWVEGMVVDEHEVTLIAVADPSRRGVDAVRAALG